VTSRIESEPHDNFGGATHRLALLNIDWSLSRLDEPVLKHSER
jgi:hypothetical protein